MSVPAKPLPIIPHYLMGTIDPRLYKHGMREAEHVELLEALDAFQGAVLLSSYAHPLYADRLGHWTTVRRTTRNQANDVRTEVLWLNPVAARHATLDLELTEVPA